MLEVTDEALKKLMEYMGEQKQNVRLDTIMTGCGCAALPEVRLTLSETNDDDEVFNIGGITFVIGKKLVREAKWIKVDYEKKPRNIGFVISAAFN